MSRETELTINFEITVPRIILPTPSNYPTHVKAHTKEQTSKPNDNGEQIQFTVFDPSNHIQPELEPQDLQKQVITRANQAGIFRLFFIKYVTTPGYRFLLQVLRHQPASNSHNDDKVSRQPFVTAELFIQLEYQASTHAPAKAPLKILPGLNRITIIYNEENTPGDYTIDGIED